MKNLTAALVLLLGLCTGAAHATMITIDDTSNGWYTASNHLAGNPNTSTGWFGASNYNSYYNFVLPDLPVGETVQAAWLTFKGDNGAYRSTNPYETLQIWDVTSSPGLGSPASVYGDLQSGTQYGQVQVFGTNNAPMPEFSVDLDPVSFADIMADKYFSVGAHLYAPNHVAGINEVLWAGSINQHAASLTLITGPVQAPDPDPVPEPSSLALFGIACAALVKLRRGRQA
jgi:hypothetical protein